MTPFSISYGRQKLGLGIPKERVVGVLAPQEVQPVPDVGAAVRTALAQPVGSDPFEALIRGRKSVLILTVDNTRPSPEAMLVPTIEACRKQGLAATVINATGRHRQMTDSELESHLGKYIVGNCRVLQHDPFDSSNMVSKGVTARGPRPGQT